MNGGDVVGTLVHRARQAKHRAYLAYKPYRFPVAEKAEPLYRLAHRVKPPSFDAYEWTTTHLPHDEPLTHDATEPLPRKIYCFWTGENALSPNRERSLGLMREMHAGIDVRLITPANLSDIVLPTHPLHPAYDDLSLVHRADYLRCYVIHLHGGGYADIKKPFHPWGPVFDRMDAGDAWLGGYRVPVRLMGPNMPDPRLERKMVQFTEHRLGQCSYLGRPDTPISREWWRELNRVLDEQADALHKNPGNARGDNPRYPLPFTSILAQILDPLEVKYRQHLLYDDRLYPHHSDYL